MKRFISIVLLLFVPLVTAIALYSMNTSGGVPSTIIVTEIETPEQTSAPENTAVSRAESAPVSGSSFTNAYGTATTKCAHSGCSNPIASSGDTNCCTAHSNKCLECGKYIDGDAMYCMSCLSSSLTGSSSGSSYSGSSYSSSYDSYDSYDYSSGASDPYGYGMPEAGESFSDYVQRVDPQLYSDMEDIFNSMY